MSVFGGWWKWIFSCILAKETEEDASQGWVQLMGGCEDFEIGLEGHQVSRTGWVRVTEEVVIGLVGATLRGTVAHARLLEATLLYLERQDIVYPFSEYFLLCEGE